MDYIYYFIKILKLIFEKRIYIDYEEPKVNILITVIIPILALLLTILVYLRENRKYFQEKIFESKLSAYNEVVQKYGILYEDLFSFLEVFQEFEGSLEEWETRAQPLFAKYYREGLNLKLLFYKYSPLLPENILEKMNDLTSSFLGHITSHSHIGTDMPHNSYPWIEEKLINFIEEVRRDLQTDALNFGVSKRIAKTFYPFEITLPNKG